MSTRHKIPELPEPLVTNDLNGEFVVGLPEGPQATFLMLWLPSLTQREASELATSSASASRLIFVSYRQASAEARDALRSAGISFAGEDGRVFLRAPGIFVERDGLQRPVPEEHWAVPSPDWSAVRNPFAKLSGRVPRWMLLHHDDVFSPSGLAKDVDLSQAVVSRVLRALEDAALVRDEPRDSTRRRSVRLERSRALLDAWLPYWQRRRIGTHTWDIGASDPDGACELLAGLGNGEREAEWAVGGLAGAATIRRVVEPADVLVWASAEGAKELANELQPQPTRSTRGVVRVRIAPDPWTLALSSRRDGLPVADPVQLWLDCATGGERSLEAADAVAKVVGWA